MLVGLLLLTAHRCHRYRSPGCRSLAGPERKRRAQARRASGGEQDDRTTVHTQPDVRRQPRCLKHQCRHLATIAADQILVLDHAERIDQA
ncbi:hypothetical protein, partial [Xanthomonas oryzae]|uniref:hypothetical protein n=1 Tax=Xanthomonas oryzae TaxID=347 RepID=UPI001C669BA0